MTPYGFPPAYTPGQPTPRPTLTPSTGSGRSPDASEITAGQKLCAKLAKAEYIAGDGYYCYRWLNGRVESKQWYGDRYSMNWLDTGKGELPAGAVKVDG